MLTLIQYIGFVIRTSNFRGKILCTSEEQCYCCYCSSCIFFNGSGNGGRKNLLRHNGIMLHCDRFSTSIFRNAGTIERPNMIWINEVNTVFQIEDAVLTKYWDSIVRIYIYNPIELRKYKTQSSAFLRFFGF